MKTVLYADDDMDDRSWVMDACTRLKSSFQIEFVKNGKEVLGHLSGLFESDFPSLIVLDLNMPELDGRKTLHALKFNSVYKHIPVIIVTTSSSKLDREICRRLGASLFLIKPNSHSEWQNIIREFEPFLYKTDVFDIHAEN